MRPAICKKQKKSLRDSKSLLFANRHVRLIAWSKPIRDSEVRTPFWLAVVQIFLYVCVRLKMRVLLQSEREVSSRDARSSFSEFDLFSERLTVTPGFCDRWIYRKIKQSPLFSKLLQILHLDASFDVIAMRFQSKKGCFSVQKMEWTALRSLHARFTRAASDKRTESGTNPRYSFGLQTGLSARTGTAGCSRSRDTVIHGAGRYSEVVEFTAESITSLSNLVRSIQIRHRIMLRHRNKLHWCGNQEKHCSINTSPPFTMDLT